ncbi:hypothetical protein, partial [Aeromonas caviae]|uniref:hypothetical protein n=1 Tax=Aeromonas caviae TaxID=648 RepID=UPI0025B6F960
ECMVFLLMGGAYLRSRIKQAGKWDQETIVSFFLCQYCSGEYLRFEYLSLRVNQEFLDSTSYILHPELFFNIVSNNLVSLNEQEKRELMNKARRDSHFDDPLKKWW